MASNYDLASVGFALDTAYNLTLSSYYVTQDDFLSIKKRNDLGIYNNSIIWPLRSNQSLSAFGGLSSTPTISFTRATTATYIGSNGLIQYANINIPRFDYDPIKLQCNGLLIENTRGNYFSNGLTLSNWGKQNSNDDVITYNAAIAPDGTKTATLYVPANINTYTRKALGTNVQQPGGTTYVFSVYLKPAGFDRVRLFFNDYNAAYYGFTIELNLTTGVVTGDVNNFTTVQRLSSGWVRYSIGCPYSLNTTSNPLISIGDPNGGDGLYGDGVSGIYVWGAQFERAPGTYDSNLYPSSLIPTTGLTATRAYDQAQLLPLTQPFFNPNNGTFYIEWLVPNTPPSYSRIISWNTQPLTILGYSGTTQINTYNGLNQGSDITTNPPVIGTPNRAAISYTATGTLSGYSMVLNGGTVLSATYAPFGTTINRIYIGGTFNGDSGNLNGWVRQLEYYNITVPSNTIKALTVLS
jgi:hypothetical protein